MRLAIGVVTAVMMGTMTAALSHKLSAPSMWKNENNSVLMIDSVDGDGVIKGSFMDRSSDAECRGSAYPIKGRVFPNGLYFAATFPPCFKVTTWQGKISRNTMRTTYVYDYVNEHTGIMTGVSGSDIFTKVR